MKLARVLIDGTAEELVFDYAIPDGWVVSIGCRVSVPLQRRVATGTVLEVHDDEPVGFVPRAMVKLLDPEPVVSAKMMEMARWMARYYGSSLEAVMRALLPESVRREEHGEKSRKIACLVGLPDEAAREKLAKRAPKQHAILLQLEISPERRLPLQDLGAGATVNALVKQGWVRVENEAVRRDPEATEAHVLPSEPLVLNPQQEIALKKIVENINASCGTPLLLLGVTGSGKTEVYLQAAQRALELGKSVLVMVPEIALTPQTIQRFKSRFATRQDEIAILHSHLSQGERFDEWHRIRTGKARIVIGARSAVFAPLLNLGLILVDEEHESSYKQDVAPRYNGRDIAVLRAAREKCALVLGSATPSLESWNNVLRGKYEVVKITERADDQVMPLVRVVDMKLETTKNKGGIFSDRLCLAMEQRLEKGEQIILFLNRRGFARSLQCGSCGHVCECQHCSLPMTYHRTDERLICHICGHQAIVPKKCPSCRDPGIALQGFGTQKIEEILQKLLPNARVARIDADSMRRKHALRDTLNAFKANKIDILIGTQMIAKGLHFPNVTLVGILNADLGLHIPDFRAAERTFQLMTQVAGRAGRGLLEGEVIVQTFTPHAPSIQYARKHDFEGFAEHELQFRREFSYPPFTHCAVLTARSTHEARAEFTLQNIHLRLKENCPEILLLSEPVPSPLVRTHGQFRFQITLRCTHARTLTEHVAAVLARTPPPEDVIVTYDMDAQNFS